jgi:hypothetical protein
MRTQDEIVDHLRNEQNLSEEEVLLPYLDFEHAEEFLKPKMTREKWEVFHTHDSGQRRFPLEESAILPEFRSYAALAWSKAQDHRGLSASRSMYGCPQLRIVCEAFGFPIPDDEATQRMIRGLPCTGNCERGCGDGDA